VGVDEHGSSIRVIEPGTHADSIISSSTAAPAGADLRALVRVRMRSASAISASAAPAAQAGGLDEVQCEAAHAERVMRPASARAISSKVKGSRAGRCVPSKPHRERINASISPAVSSRRASVARAAAGEIEHFAEIQFPVSAARRSSDRIIGS